MTTELIYARAEPDGYHRVPGLDEILDACMRSEDQMTPVISVIGVALDDDADRATNRIDGKERTAWTRARGGFRVQRLLHEDTVVTVIEKSWPRVVALIQAMIDTDVV